MALSASQSNSSGSNTPSSTVHFCSLCSKPFTNGRSFGKNFVPIYRGTDAFDKNVPAIDMFGIVRTAHEVGRDHARHATPRKPSAASRRPAHACVRKGTSCVYHEPVPLKRGEVADQRLAIPTHGAAGRLHPNPSLNVALNNEVPLQTEDMTLSEGLPSSDLITLGDEQLQLSTEHYPQSADFFAQNLSVIDASIFENVFDMHDPSHRNLERPAEISTAPPLVPSLLDLEDWCQWTRHGISLAVVTQNGQARHSPNTRLARFRNEPSHAECNADLIVQSWRAFPTMMAAKGDPALDHSRTAAARCRDPPRGHHDMHGYCPGICFKDT